ncbi:MAG: ribonuclease D [Rhodanobacteraceae bacterium]|nr:MAG: ribonuclease D [Rhodanobacteraceae bacterium]
MNAIWIDRLDALPPPTTRPLLGLDTEFMRRNTFYPQLALVQVAYDGEYWLIDPLAYDASGDLRTLIDGRVCVLHSASEDLEALAPLLGETPMQLFDTQIAAALCGLGPGLSYQKLVASILHIDIPKDETRSDWLRRPLTPGQLEYAAQDVAHLAGLHAHLTAELERRGRTAWHAEDCARLVRRAHQHHVQLDPQPQRGFASAADWSAEARTRLRRVLRWRDACARTLDKPRPWILDDAHALALAAEPPTTVEDLFARVRGQRALRGPQRAALLELLQAPVTQDEVSATAAIPPAPRGAAKHAVDAMRDVVRATATSLDLPPGLLCPRRLLDEFVVTQHWPDGLEGWRTTVLEAKLTPLLPA